MTDTPEAVRLADWLEADACDLEAPRQAAALLRRIPDLEAEVQEQARLNGMGAERELALMAQVSRLEAERDQLRAELEKVRWQSIETARTWMGLCVTCVPALSGEQPSHPAGGSHELDQSKRQAALLSEAAKLADEFRVTIPREVLAIWGAEVQAELRRLDALVAHLTADRDDTANELALRTKHNLALTTERDQLLAKLQATQAESFAGPVKWTSEEINDGYRGIRWITKGGVQGRPTAEDMTEHLIQRGEAQAEPVQAVELPALPHDGWPARFRCDSCDGNGEIGELISMGHFQPPERQTCPDCGGRGWSDEGPAFNADHMRDYARAVLSARKPLTDEQIEPMFKARNSIQAEGTKDQWYWYAWGVSDGEQAHGIGLEVKP